MPHLQVRSSTRLSPADADGVLDVLRSEGCTVDDKTEISEFGKFGWVMDPEGNRIELWEPPPGRLPG